MKSVEQILRDAEAAKLRIIRNEQLGALNRIIANSKKIKLLCNLVASNKVRIG